ncbi:calpain-like protease palB/RIM13 [Diutina catenulata]
MADASRTHMFLMDEFVDVIRLIEQSHYLAALGHTKDALQVLYSAIKLLNQLARDEYDVVDMSRYCMQHYERIKAKSYTVSQRLLWLASKQPRQPRFAPPEVDSDQVSAISAISANAPSVSGSKSVYSVASSIGDTYEDDDSELMPPIIEFTPRESSLEFDREPPVDCRMSLPRVDAEFQRIQFSHWPSKGCSELYQDLLPNCSFVSSLLSVSDKGDLSGLVYPHKPSTNYRIKLFFNGCWRIVTVDNSLPLIRRSQRSLVVRSYSDPLLLWPALIEKAYLKVMGQGYEFSGSNMTQDTYMISGWVPELVLIKNYTLPPDFDEIWRQSLLGKCVVGLGTGKLSKELARELGLIAHHDYVFEFYSKMKKEVVVKNPWVTSDKYSDRFVKCVNSCPFQYLYVNWDVKRLFSYSRLVNFVYSARDEVNNAVDTPQYYVRNPTNDRAEVWLFLEFHLQQHRRPASQVLGFHVYQTAHGERVLSHRQYPKVAGDADTNNRLRLIKLRMDPNSSYTITTTSNVTGTFSLAVYDNLGPELSFGKASNLYAHLNLLEAELTVRNSGGSWAHASYIRNPQYDVQIKEDMPVVVAVFASKLDTMINVHMFNVDASRRGLPIRSFDKARLIQNDNYNPGTQYYHFPSLPRGSYKLVVSAYDPQTLDKLKVYVNYGGAERTRCSIHPISTSLGLFCKSTQFEWGGDNRRKLKFATDHYGSKLTLHIRQALDQADVITNYRPAVRCSVFSAQDGTPVVINEEWDNSVYGVFVDVTLTLPGVYILLLERFEAGTGRCIVEFGCNKAFEIGSL